MLRMIGSPFGGDDCNVGSKSVTNLALLLHELATNASKYGALSAVNGRLQVTLEKDGDTIRLVWQETGGPPPSIDGTAGFGSRLERGVSSAFGATIARDWRPTGLVASISMSEGALGA